MNRLLGVEEHVERSPFGLDEAGVEREQIRRGELAEVFQDRVNGGTGLPRGCGEDRRELLVWIAPHPDVSE
jgi:hypothetical protein